MGRGTRVAALHTNSHRYVEAYYATAMLGGVFVPVNYRAKRPELEHMLKSSEAQVLFVGERYLPEVDSLRSALPKLELLVGFEGARSGMPAHEELLAGATELQEEAEVDDDDTSILMFTSGTTSLPKGVMLRYGDFSRKPAWEDLRRGYTAIKQVG